MNTKWDKRFLRLAREVSTWSKDPSTKVGAVIVDSDRQVVSLGYNGFPSKLDDLEDRLINRDIKLKYTIHAEMNAVLNAKRSVRNCTLYTWPFMSCDRCAVHMIQSGITRFISVRPSAEIEERWKDSIAFSKDCIIESDTVLIEYDPRYID